MKNRMENGAETLDLGWHKDGNVGLGHIIQSSIQNIGEKCLHFLA